MKLTVNVSPFHAEVMGLIQLHYRELVEEYDLPNRTIQADIRVIYDIVANTTMVDPLTELNQYVSEKIYNYMTFKLRHVSMLLISHMVCELLESEAYRQMRRCVNRAIAGTSNLHWGVVNVTSATAHSRLLITVTKRITQEKSNENNY